MLVLVYQSIDRLLSRKSSAVKSDKAGLGDKVPHKTTMWFCGFLGRVFLHGMVLCEFSTQLFRNVLVNAARRIASSRRSSFSCFRYPEMSVLKGR
jgi:hypothetical protein